MKYRGGGAPENNAPARVLDLCIINNSDKKGLGGILELTEAGSCHPENYSCHPEALAEGSEKRRKGFFGLRPQNDEKRKRAAFTMAEVLITLGIIGIVAAMTLPVAIRHYNKRVTEVRLEHFYSLMNQAITAAEVKYGDKAYWPEMKLESATYEDNLEWVDTYITPFIKVLKKEKCSSGLVCLTFINGSKVRISRDNFSFYPKANPTENIRGKTYFEFIFAPNNENFPYAKDKGVEPYVGSWRGDVNQLYKNSVYGCTGESTTGEGNGNKNKYCTKIIQMNGWKIPDDYPFRF